MLSYRAIFFPLFPTSSAISQEPEKSSTEATNAY